MTEMMTERMRTITVVTVCLLFVSFTHKGLGQHVFDINHVNSRGVPIRNLAYDKETDTLFVGANGTILALDGGNMSIKQIHTNHSIKNENLVLEVINDETYNYLLACGTFDGTCERRNLENIDRITSSVRYKSSSTVSNNEVRLVLLPNDNKVISVLFYARSYSKYLNYDPVSYYPIRVLHLESLTDESRVSQPDDLSIAINEVGNYPIVFKAILESENFIYFLSQQNDSSKLSKMCKSDYYKSTYEDIFISCNHGEKTFRYVQDGLMVKLTAGLYVVVALFTDTSEVDHSTTGAFCLFTEIDIQRGLLISRKNRFKCPKHDLPFKIFEYKEQTEKCVNLSDTSITIPPSFRHLVSNLTFCDSDREKVIVGLTNMTGISDSIIEKGPRKMTARFSNYSHTVYVGTSLGLVKQYYIYMDTNEQGKSMFVNDISLNGNQKAVKDIKVFSDSVFVATDDKVFKFREPKCEEATNCSECMKTGSIKCGWCVLQQKCTEANLDQCKLYKKGNHWLPSVKGQCMKINHTNSKTPFSEENSINRIPSFHIEFDPKISLDGISVLCKFRGSEKGAPFDGKMCSLELPNTTTNSITELEMYAKDSEDSKNWDGYHKIASHNFFLYKCKDYRSCYDCQQDERTNCRWDYKIAKCGQGNVQVLEKCSHINGEQIKKVYENQTVDIEFAGLYIFSTFQYKCSIDMLRVNASVSTSNNTLICQSVVLKGPRRTLDVRFSQIVGENETNIYAMMNRSMSTAKIEVYTCDELLEYLDDVEKSKNKNRRKKDCSSCKYFRQLGYECNWIDGGCIQANRSTYDECPRPTLESISPESGPTAGNTPVTITGTNLGVFRNESSVEIGGAPCKVMSFDEKRRLICRTDKISNKEMISLVRVRVNNKTSTENNIKFEYKDPTLDKLIGHKKGIKSGGGFIRLKGRNFHIGSQYRIKLQRLDGYNVIDCPLWKENERKKNNQYLTCITPAVTDQTLGKYNISVIVDDNTVIGLMDDYFEYLDNPKLQIPKKLVSIKGGGTEFKITAENNFDFTILESAYVSAGNKKENCLPSKKVLTCAFPPYEVSSARRKKRDTSTDVLVTVQLDGFKQTIGTVTYKSNPSFKNLTEVFEYDPSEAGLLELQGSNLMLVVDDPELYTVQIGSGICYIRNLTDERILCLPPPNEPSPAPGDNSLHIRVKVFNLKLLLGEAKYIQELNVIMIAMIILACGLVVGGILMTMIIFKVKRRGQREISKILMEMQKLEEETREEGKDEFASMQLTITDIKSDLVSTGIPYHDYQAFIMNVLFPTGDQKDTLLKEVDVSPCVRSAMDRFETLLRSKFFMKSLISTLEKQRRITMQDKAHFSSMLAVVMMGRMTEYFEIVQYTLSSLIDSTPKKQHKVLFNRFDSITLRLLIYWMNVALYPYFKDGGGTSLFMFYRAIQTVVEKRPVDDVTGDAKNTLAEEHFLRSKVDFKIINLIIDLNGDGIEFRCEVLDCDTISQVKRKCLLQIYKNRPRSQMPAVDEVILEWRMGKSGKLQLNDFDQTSIKTEDKIQMNTLHHYNVIDNSRMAICYKFSPPNPGQLEEEDLYCNQSAAPNDVTIQMPAVVTVENLENLYKWHLEETTDDESENPERKMSKFHIKEGKSMYLTSLMHTKLILQEYIHGLFEHILAHRHMPPVIHYLFCILDNMAKTKGVDQETLQSWKSESYAIRIWATLTACPEILFDIDRPKHVDPCLKSINQLLIDSFHSTKITKESSLQKLLFATEVPMYQAKVEKFFKYLSNTEGISENQFATEMSKLSYTQQTTLTLKKLPALQKIYKFIQSYMEDILEDLEEDDETRDLAYRAKLENIIEEMDKSED